MKYITTIQLFTIVGGNSAIGADSKEDWTRWMEINGQWFFDPRDGSPLIAVDGLGVIPGSYAPTGGKAQKLPSQEKK